MRPARQVLHAPAPGSALYLPASHCAQLAPVCPLSHSQSVFAALGTLLSAPFVLHSVHAVLPCPFFTVPAGHATHAALTRPAPALHTHAALPTAIVPSNVPHGWHSGFVPPVVGPNEPAGQFSHDPLPVPCLYLPTAHAVHWVPPAPVEPAGHGVITAAHVNMLLAPGTLLKLALQVHCVMLLLSLGPAEFTGHRMHCAGGPAEK